MRSAETEPNCIFGEQLGDSGVAGDYLGSTIYSAKSIAVGRNADGRLEVFSVRPNDLISHLWQIELNGSWSNDAQLGSNVDRASSIAVGQNQDGRLELFFVAGDAVTGYMGIHHAWQITKNDGWSGTSFLGTTAADNSRKAVSVARDAAGCLEVFSIGADDNEIHFASQVQPNGSWTTWGPFATGHEKAKQVALGRNHDGHLELFYHSADDYVYHTWQLNRTVLQGGACVSAGDWSAPVRLGTAADRAYSVSVGRNADGRLEVFAIGRNSAIRHVWQTQPNDGWSSWQRLGTTANTAKSVIVGTNRDGRLEAFTVGTNDKPYHFLQLQPNQSWSGELPFP